MDDIDIKRWKIKNFIKKLKNIRSNNATGLISLVISPKSQISLTQEMLANEVGTSANIKSHVNKLAVLSAIASTQQRLKLYKTIPDNGLIIYCGQALVDGKEKKVTYDIEPFSKITTNFYRCDNRFHVDVLEDLLLDEKIFGFIIMDGKGVMFAKVQGNNKQILTNYGVDLPKKHKKGGQSSQRFQRIRLEKMAAYIKKTCELAIQVFIQDNKPIISGIFVAGLAEYKNHLVDSEFFDIRLKPLIIKVVDIAYGGVNGLNQAIDSVKAELGNIELVKEKESVNELFRHIRDDSGMVVFGLKETFEALEAQVIDKLLVYDNFPYYYSSTGLTLDAGDNLLFTEWISDNYHKLNCQVSYISNNTGEGMQFIKGFNGISGILKYQWTPTETKDEQVIEDEHKDLDNNSIDLDDFFM